MTKRKLKPYVVTLLYTFSIIMLVASAYFVQDYLKNNKLDSGKEEPLSNVEDVIKNYDIEEPTNEMPVINTEKEIEKPFKDETIEIAQKFYDPKATKEDQENSIIYYEGTYMQNSGVDYKGKDKFDVVAILDGKVEEVKEDDILGKIVQIKHENDLISVYQSLSDINVKENDVIKQGDVIGKSGESNINKDLGNHLHFELYFKGVVVNPEEYYGKATSELN